MFSDFWGQFTRVVFETGLRRMLTSKTVEALRPDPSRRIEIAAGGAEGLVLRITPAGVKTWMLRYRIDGQRRKLTIGRFPAIGLADARKLAVQSLGKVASGEDPVAVKEERRKAAMTVRVDTLEQLTDEYFAAAVARKKANTIAYERWLWGKHVAPRLGKARIIELRRPDILAFVRKVGQDAGPRTANYAHALVRQLLNFAIQEERLEFNPASMPRVFEYKTRERVLSETEVRRFWVTAEAAMTDRDVPVSPATVLALKLCALTLQRAGEIAGMTASEIDWRDGVWILPGERTKNGRTHIVPLSTQAMEVLCAAVSLALTDFRMSGVDRAGTAVSRVKARLRTYKGPFPLADRDVIERYKGPLFPSWVRAGESVDRHTVSRGMARVLQEAGIKGASAHDLRRTGASFMASSRCRVLTEIISRVLNHTPGGAAVTLIYNRYDYAEEKREALQKWADTLMQIVSVQPSGTDQMGGHSERKRKLVGVR